MDGLCSFFFCFLLCCYCSTVNKQPLQLHYIVDVVVVVVGGGGNGSNGERIEMTTNISDFIIVVSAKRRWKKTKNAR